MPETNILDATVNEIQKYMDFAEISQDNTEISLQPYFKPGGNITKFKYEVYSENSNFITHEVNMDIGSIETKLDHEDYWNWTEEVKENFPNAEISCSSRKDLSPIENSLRNADRFQKMTRLNTEEIAIMVDLAYHEDSESLAIDYNIRTAEHVDREFKLDDRKVLEDYSEERIVAELYPLWVTSFEEEFGEIQYTEFEDLSYYFNIS